MKMSGSAPAATCFTSDRVGDSAFYESVADFGANHTLNAICQRYWIIKVAVTVRRMISKCVNCRR